MGVEVSKVNGVILLHALLHVTNPRHCRELIAELEKRHGP